MIVDHYFYLSSPLLNDLSKSFIIFSISIEFFHPLGKLYDSIPSWNIESMGIIWCVVPTIPICINPCKFMYGKCYTYSKNLIILDHSYNWYTLRVNPIFTPTSSTPPSPPYQYHTLYHIETPETPPNLILIKPTQSMYHIKLLYRFLNQLITQSLFTTSNALNFRQNYNMVRYACDVRHTISYIPWIPHLW